MWNFVLRNLKTKNSEKKTSFAVEWICGGCALQPLSINILFTTKNRIEYKKEVLFPQKFFWTDIDMTDYLLW